VISFTDSDQERGQGRLNLLTVAQQQAGESSDAFLSRRVSSPGTTPPGLVLQLFESSVMIT